MADVRIHSGQQEMLQSVHGGDIYRNPVKMDFSVNVNPLGMPEGVKRALHLAVDACETYPDIREAELKEALSASTGIPQTRLLCGSGASQLLLAVVQTLRPGRTVMPVPSFYGYEYAACAGGGEVAFYRMRKEQDYRCDAGIYELLTPETELLFLANPNNPVGNLTDSAFLEELISYCGEQGIYVVLDECFIEFCREREKASFLGRLQDFPNLLVLRAFTKSYAMPGVRLGYLACSDEELLGKIGVQLPEWNLSAFAQRAGVAALEEKDYLERTVDYVEQERNFLVGNLRRLGIRVYDSCANFLLLYSETLLYETLLERGILIRDCNNFRGLSEGYYRIAVRSTEENRRFVEAVEQVMDEGHGGAEVWRKA
jgi:histidinol-phosphate aminotransferase